MRSNQLAGRIVTINKDRFVSNIYANALKAKMDSIGDHHGFEHARYIDVNSLIREKFTAFAVIRIHGIELRPDIISQNKL